jgi:hypothetical protein
VVGEGCVNTQRDFSVGAWVRVTIGGFLGGMEGVVSAIDGETVTVMATNTHPRGRWNVGDEVDFLAVALERIPTNASA